MNDALNRLQESLDATAVLSRSYASDVIAWASAACSEAYAAGRESAPSALLPSEHALLKAALERARPSRDELIDSAAMPGWVDRPGQLRWIAALALARARELDNPPESE